VQTAEPLAAELTPGKPPAVSERLAAGELKPRKLSKAVTEVGGKVVVLVGHQPDLGEYAAWLLGSDGDIKFEKGGAACVAVGDVEEGSGTLEWLVPPAWFLPAG
jgi:phosphohistidine phosphatase SixA